MSNDKCEFCKGTGKEPGEAECVWCFSTGTKEGQALLTPPVRQRQGEPVALPERHVHEHHGCFLSERQHGWNACLDKIAKLGPLYTHADPAGDPTGSFDKHMEYMGRCHKLEKKLAEAHALLRDIELTMDAQEDSVSLGYDIEMRMATILRPSASAEPSVPIIHPINMKTMMQAYEKVNHKAMLHGTSNWCAAMATSLRGVLQAEPSAPVEIDERAEFEAAWSARIKRLRLRERGNEFYRVQPNDLYRWNNVQDAWELWQARAALERKP